MGSKPASSSFKAGAGIIGYKIFGLVILFAAITSIIGAAYTSVSFLKTLHPFIMENEKWFVIGFIAVSTVIMRHYLDSRQLFWFWQVP